MPTILVRNLPESTPEKEFELKLALEAAAIDRKRGINRAVAIVEKQVTRPQPGEPVIIAVEALADNHPMIFVAAADLVKRLEIAAKQVLPEGVEPLVYINGLVKPDLMSGQKPVLQPQDPVTQHELI